MKQILVVEDDTHLLQALQLLLEYSDFTVVRAKDGQQAIEIVRSSPVDLVISDIGMPNKDGLELLKQISTEYPSLKVIAMSGIATHADVCLKVAQQLGAVSTLKKPFSQASLLALISESLGINSEPSANLT